ncbi:MULTISPECIES: hypothetical protein [Actinoplanes]|uniref:hypothetical protein n=1 Tax=Actinoplanes TaxID=1865 RepID=UPI0005F2A7E3|nr:MULTISPECIES: hypothetical protein [Actinoplanes]GLY01078.1 hypothetical protein Acsp01_14570 [Actinoplanes sp. NBRC 101535]
MTSSQFPPAGARVELDTGDERLAGVRVVHVDEPAVIISMAADQAPLPGDTVTLRWPAGPRGRYAARASVLDATKDRVELRQVGDPVVEQFRDFVRGGGGESILLVRPGETESIGWVHDISERSVRAHFTDVDLRPGNRMVLRIQLGPETVEFPATAVKVSAMRQQVPFRGPLSVEMVAVFEQDERQAKIIRRYVLRNQLLSRALKSALA